MGRATHLPRIELPSALRGVAALFGCGDVSLMVIPGATSVKLMSLPYRTPSLSLVSYVSIGMVGKVISTPWLNTLLCLYLEPINVVIFHETIYT